MAEKITVDIKTGWYEQLMTEINKNKEFSKHFLSLPGDLDSDECIAHHYAMARDDRVITNLKNNLASTGEAVISPQDYGAILYILLENSCTYGEHKEGKFYD